MAIFQAFTGHMHLVANLLGQHRHRTYSSLQNILVDSALLDCSCLLTFLFLSFSSPLHSIRHEILSILLLKSLTYILVLHPHWHCSASFLTWTHSSLLTVLFVSSPKASTLCPALLLVWSFYSVGQDDARHPSVIFSILTSLMASLTTSSIRWRLCFCILNHS